MPHLEQHSRIKLLLILLVFTAFEIFEIVEIFDTFEISSLTELAHRRHLKLRDSCCLHGICDVGQCLEDIFSACPKCEIFMCYDHFIIDYTSCTSHNELLRTSLEEQRIDQTVETVTSTANSKTSNKSRPTTAYTHGGTRKGVVYEDEIVENEQITSIQIPVVEHQNENKEKKTTK